MLTGVRANNLISAILMSFSCVVLTASCVQTAMPERKDEDARVPGARVADFGDTGDGPPVSNVGSELGTSPGFNPESSQSAGLPTAREICLAAGRAGVEAREAFCRSSLVPPHGKEPCWRRVLLSLPEWIGWCTWNY